MFTVRRSRKIKHNQTAAASEPVHKKKLRSKALPDELIVEILSWLPPKCAGRCKIACKSWRAIIQSPHFIEQHMQRQDYIMLYRPPPLLPPDQQPYEGIFCLSGLLLEQNMISKGTYRIRSYATNQMFELPELNERQISGSMCHLPTSDDYKVLNLHWKENDTKVGLKVFTKGIDVRWRCVEIPLLLSCSKNNDDKVFSRAIGSVSYILKFSKSGSKMMAFQIEDESFVEISLPWTVQFCATGSRFFPMIWDSDVSIGHYVGEELHIWVLQDYKTSKWDKRKIVFPSTLLKKRPFIVRLVPNCVFDGEILVLDVPVPIRKIMREVSYNVKTKAVRLTRMTQRIRPSLVSF